MQHEDFERLRNSIMEFAEYLGKAIEPTIQAIMKVEAERRHRDFVLRTQLAIYTHCKHRSVQHKIAAINKLLRYYEARAYFFRDKVR